MTPTLGIMLLLTAFTVTGDGDQYVDRKEFTVVQAKLEHAEATLKKAEKHLADFQTYRYSSFVSGSRTWRMDLVTGKTCIMLTSDADWKKPDTKTSSCSCEDFFRDNHDSLNDEKQSLRKLSCGW